jgi:hypothetical protein
MSVDEVMREKVLRESVAINPLEVETLFATIVEGEAVVITPEGKRLKLGVGAIIAFTRVKGELL